MSGRKLVRRSTRRGGGGGGAQRRSQRLSALATAWKSQRVRRVRRQDTTTTTTTTTRKRRTRRSSNIVQEDVEDMHEEDEDEDEDVDEEEEEGNTGRRVTGPATRTRSRNKRKIKPTIQDEDGDEDEAKEEADTNNNASPPEVPKAEEQSNFEGHLSNKADQGQNTPSASLTPDKRILQQILDKLQREDTYEIFAEPVDADKVKDYYKIIKEPMDFGTMRAKLHEGMYKNLQQFECDVFLISQNAMHFNSPGTIFFKQAREIDDLAKRIFHLLKTDPEKLESELSEAKQRPTRRTRGKAKVSVHSPCHKLATKKSGKMKCHGSSKSKPSSCSGPSTCKRSTRASDGYLTTAAYNYSRDHATITCPIDDKRYGTIETDRRQTYRPPSSFFPSSFFYKNDATISTTENPNLLIHVNQQDIDYRNSLMLFVKDLGPTAQRVAERKLQRWPASAHNGQKSVSDFSLMVPTSQTFASSNFSGQDPSIPHTSVGPSSHALLNIPRPKANAEEKSSDGMTMNLCKYENGKHVQNGRVIVVSGLLAVKSSKSSGKQLQSSSGKEVHTSHETSAVHANSGNDKVNQNVTTHNKLQPFSSSRSARNLNVSVELKLEDGAQQAGLLLEQPQAQSQSQSQLNSNAAAIFRGNGIFLPTFQPLQNIAVPGYRQTQNSSWGNLYEIQGGRTVAAVDPRLSGNNSSYNGAQMVRINQSVIPQFNQFALNLPYLRARLDQVNSMGNNMVLPQQNPNIQGNLTDQRGINNWQLNDTRQSSSSDPPKNIFTLQL